MPQTSVIIAYLVFGLLIYIIARGRTDQYIRVFVG